MEIHEEAFEALSTYSRKHEREEMDVPVTLELVLADGQVFATGSGRLRDLSAEGALVTNIELDADALPIEKFTLSLKIEGGKFAGVQAEATPVRFAMTPEYGLGVSVTSLSMDLDA